MRKLGGKGVTISFIPSDTNKETSRQIDRRLIGQFCQQSLDGLSVGVHTVVQDVCDDLAELVFADATNHNGLDILIRDEPMAINGSVARCATQCEYPFLGVDVEENLSDRNDVFGIHGLFGYNYVF